MRPILLWLRADLRLHDNPALSHAAALAQSQGRPLLPVAVVAPPELTRWGFARVGPHRQRVLQQALTDLAEQLRALNSGLLLLHGHAASVLPELARRLGTRTLVCSEHPAPEEQAQLAALRERGLHVLTHWQGTLLDPAALPFARADLPQVFARFRQRLQQTGVQPATPLPAPQHLPALPSTLELCIQNWPPAHTSNAHGTTDLIALDARASVRYDQPGWAAGERAGLAHWQRYQRSPALHRYKATRNQLSGPDFASHCAHWLALGAISPRHLAHGLNAVLAEQPDSEGAQWLMQELLWRDYFWLLHAQHGARLYRRWGLRGQPITPLGPARPLASEAGTAPAPDEALARWTQGRTGWPLVDAAMTELRASGYLSNRLRQVAASAWLHELGGDWRAGAAWFESQLIDYDPCSNTGNWLYIAGLGTDPRGGRRFDIAHQTRTHDPHGHYRRLWLGADGA
ncbi:MAG: DASH family cryptochrome [Rhodoferax sp.]